MTWALTDFSGYVAIDELYDGPFCVLSIVDNRTFKRLFYQVLDHDPTHDDMLAFFQRFQTALQARQLTVHGITTDGSPLYPAAIAAVFGPVPHQICEFHILKEVNHAVLRAVAQVRKQLAAQQPKLKRGRPTPQQRPLVRKRQRLQQKIADLFEYRHLFVQRHLTPAERATLQRITRGLPHLRALRQIVEEVYRLFDRRCRTATALAKLARLRQRVQRFSTLCQVLKGLFSANLEKALTFLDDRLLGATSNAVERGNRRYRKMQKTVYRVRTADHIAQRLALDLFREKATSPRRATLSLLHADRAGPRTSPRAWISSPSTSRPRPPSSPRRPPSGRPSAGSVRGFPSGMTRSRENGPFITASISPRTSGTRSWPRPTASCFRSVRIRSSAGTSSSVTARR